MPLAPGILGGGRHEVMHERGVHGIDDGSGSRSEGAVTSGAPGRQMWSMGRGRCDKMRGMGGVREPQL